MDTVSSNELAESLRESNQDAYLNCLFLSIESE
jgi:hypothetical protein